MHLWRVSQRDFRRLPTGSPAFHIPTYTHTNNEAITILEQFAPKKQHANAANERASGAE